MKKTFTLKHIIIAFLVGVAVMTSGSVLADKVSQIGNKVAGETAVYVNGERVSDAVIIKDKSYAPLRDIAEELGANVEWKGSAGVMINNEVDWEQLKRVSDLKANIETSQKTINELEAFINKYNDEHLSEYGENVRIIYQEQVERKRIDLAAEQAKLVQYEKELQELESTK